MIRAVVTGISGRMGSEILRCAGPELQVVAGTLRVGGPAAALSERLGIPVLEELGAALELGADVVLDFTLPEAAGEHLRTCAERGVPLVLGTTGLGPEMEKEIAKAAEAIPLVYAPNTSVGIHLLARLVAEAARTLGEDFDVEIVEAHHRNKRDAPSGTALFLGKAAAEARDWDFDEVACYGREGEVGPRPSRQIALHTLRGGDVAGEHSVHFYGDGERLELGHRASSRETFARGALRAARWVVGKAPGLYGMKDVLS